MKTEHLLEIENFSLSFRMYEKGMRRKNLQVISNLSLSVNAGEVTVIVGSSGSGKSLLAHAVLGILPRNAQTGGEIRYKGRILDQRYLRKLRGRELVFVPQSVNNLDPRMKVGEQVRGIFGTEEQVRQAFARYDLPEETAGEYPFQLSGGMARRVLISMAVLHEPMLVIADEPTPGLGKEMAEEILQDFREIADHGAGVLMITHDIDLALSVADRIAVFYAGEILEIAPKADFREDGSALRHPYSRALWNALPQNSFRPVPGRQPYAGTVTRGCSYADRCPYCSGECRDEVKLQEIRGGEVRCCHAV